MVVIGCNETLGYLATINLHSSRGAIPITVAFYCIRWDIYTGFELPDLFPQQT